jgi:hypothetical protein
VVSPVQFTGWGLAGFVSIGLLADAHAVDQGDEEGLDTDVERAERNQAKKYAEREREGEDY